MFDKMQGPICNNTCAIVVTVLTPTITLQVKEIHSDGKRVVDNSDHDDNDARPAAAMISAASVVADNEVNVHSAVDQTQKLQSEFHQLLRPYTADSGMTKDDIDEELFNNQAKLRKFRKQGRHETPRGKKLQSKINDLKRLVELRRLLVSNRAQEFRSEFHKLLRPYTADSGMTKEDIDDELAEDRAAMARLFKKKLHETRKGKELQREIKDLERLVELRDLLKAISAITFTKPSV